jgi:glycosyltransferase involved in cell wall biosynthesis
MKILHVTPILPNSFLAGIYGKSALTDRFASGGAVYVYELARAQARLGGSVTVVYPSVVPFDELRDGVRFIGIRGFMQKPFSRIDPFGIVPLQVLLSSDAVHVHQPRCYLALGVSFLTLLFRKPLFVTDLGKTGKLTIPSSFVTKYLDISRFASHTHPDDKTLVVYAGIDIVRYHPVKDAHHARLTRPYLFYAGAIREHKGQHHIVEVFLKLYKKYPSLDLVLAGGIIQSWYLEKIKMLGKPLGSRLRIEGIVSEKRLVSLYQNCDIFVSCSSHELFGLAIGEAMSCGKPVVALGVGSVPELVRDGNDGFVVPGQLWRTERKDYSFPLDFMVSAICRLLDNRNLAKSFGENAQRRIRSLFTWDSVAKSTLSTYEENMT